MTEITESPATEQPQDGVQQGELPTLNCIQAVPEDLSSCLVAVVVDALGSRCSSRYPVSHCLISFVSSRSIPLLSFLVVAPSNKKARSAETTVTASSASSGDIPSSRSAGRRLLSYTPQASKISPTYGPMEGNSLIMVEHQSVSYNNEAIECAFGSSKTTGTRINNTLISCRTPKHSTGSKNFDLYVAGIKMSFASGGSQLTFTYFRKFLFDYKSRLFLSPFYLALSLVALTNPVCDSNHVCV